MSTLDEMIEAMNNPLDTLKRGIRQYLEAREKATQGEWNHIPADSYFGQDLVRVDPNNRDVDENIYVPTCGEDAQFITLAANQSAQFARHLLVAIEALEKFPISELNQGRLDKVDPEQLRMIILHGSHVAKDALDIIAKGHA